MHSFYYISRLIGKGERDRIKRIYVIDKNQQIKNTYVDRERIQREKCDYNEAHFKKAHDTIAHKDKIYVQLRDDNIRDKILEGNLSREEYDDERVFKFLKLLKVLSGLRQCYKEISIVDW